MSLSAGERVGPYEIVAPIGEGGMGVVYRARDTRLQREVAIKFSQADFGERFEREARSIAALNHPHICTLHDVGPNYLVMELVEGPTLAERIAQGPVPVEEAVRLALQLASAIEAAHERGIIHRDLKPDNIKLTGQGLKVLDFGLAKAAAAVEAVDASAPTIKASASLAGIIVGTPGYMSPEQASGKPVDRRTDIWSFGVVLWEMVTGKRMFEGETISHTLAAVLTQKPDVSAAPAELRALLGRCLVQDPRLRMRDIGEARIALESPVAPQVVVSAPASRVPWRWIAGVSIAVAVVCLGLLLKPARQADQPLIELEVDMGTQLGMAFSAGSSVVLSPDGTRIAYLDGARRLWARRLNDPKAVMLTNGAVQGVFFSPDSKWIGYFDTKLRKVLADGGTAIGLWDLPVVGQSRGATWMEDGTIIFSQQSVAGLMRIPDGGGASQQVTQLDKARTEVTHRLPHALPGSKAVLFTASKDAANFNEATIDVMVLATGERKTLVRGGTHPRYLASGHILYANQDTMFAVPFDAKRLAILGSPIPVLQNVLYQANIGYSHFSASRNGMVVYRRGGSRRIGTAVWLDGSGNIGEAAVRELESSWVRVSPDGKRIAFIRQQSIWIADVGSGNATRLTFEPSSDPVFTPDGELLIFDTNAGVFYTRVDGGGKPVKLLDGGTPCSVSPDGRLLLVTNSGSKSTLSKLVRDNGVLRVERTDPLYPDEHSVGAPEYSPDGKWIAFRSSAAGTLEVIVRAFPDTGARYQISPSGGTSPVWSLGQEGVIVGEPRGTSDGYAL
ncbi:MAG: protein kinase [Bryobacteraceae bacterium]